MIMTVDCVWSEWGGWGGCSQTCGDGVATRTRSKNIFDGIDCQGQAFETQTCNLRCCPTGK